MKININRLHRNAVKPIRATKGDAGADLTAVRMTLVGGRVICDTGLAFEIPEGYFGLLVPRSSCHKKDLTMPASLGVIDSGYRGSVQVVFKRHGSNIYNVGERVAQLIILPCELASFSFTEELSDSERGSNGFGHTGK